MSIGDQYSGYRHPFFFAVHYFGGVGGTQFLTTFPQVKLILTDKRSRQPKDSEYLIHMGILPGNSPHCAAHRTGHVRVFG